MSFRHIVGFHKSKNPKDFSVAAAFGGDTPEGFLIPQFRRDDRNVDVWIPAESAGTIFSYTFQ